MSFTTDTQWQEGPDRISFFTKRWCPAKPIAKLIFIHGFMEHILRYDHVYSRYAEAGIEVFAFDQRGFGQTAAKTSTQGDTSWAQALSDIDFFVKQEASTVSSKVFLMGHSMRITHSNHANNYIDPSLTLYHSDHDPKGGALAFAYFTRPTPLPSSSYITGGLILSSPLIQQTPAVAASSARVRLGSFVAHVMPKLTMKIGVAPQDICRDPVIQEKYARDPFCTPTGTVKVLSDMILGGQALLDRDYKRFPKFLPVLAVHGTDDKVAYWLATQELLGKTDGRDKTFLTFDEYYHEMHNEPGDDKYAEMDSIIDWVKGQQYSH